MLLVNYDLNIKDMTMSEKFKLFSRTSFDLDCAEFYTSGMYLQ